MKYLFFSLILISFVSCTANFGQGRNYIISHTIEEVSLEEDLEEGPDLPIEESF